MLKKCKKNNKKKSLYSWECWRSNTWPTLEESSHELFIGVVLRWWFMGAWFSLCRTVLSVASVWGKARLSPFASNVRMVLYRELGSCLCLVKMELGCEKAELVFSVGTCEIGGEEQRGLSLHSRKEKFGRQLLCTLRWFCATFGITGDSKFQKKGWGSLEPERTKEERGFKLCCMCERLRESWLMYMGKMCRGGLRAWISVLWSGLGLGMQIEFLWVYLSAFGDLFGLKHGLAT